MSDQELDSIAVFVDTNILLHYKPLAQIDWIKLTNAKNVTLVICMTVIKELDEKKSDSRLSERAKRAIKEIEQNASKTGSKPLRPGVVIQLYTEKLLDVDRDDSQDERIVKTAIQYSKRHPEIPSCLATEDYTMRILCQDANIGSLELDPSDRLENPGDEKDRKYKQALTELAELKNRLPKFSLEIHPFRLQVELGKKHEFQLPAIRTDIDVEAMVEAEIRAKLSAESYSSQGPSLKIGVLSLAEPNWTLYNSDFNEYIVKYRSYADSLKQWHERDARSFEFQLWLSNVGTCAATEASVYLFFPSLIHSVLKAGPGYEQAHRMPQPPSRPTLQTLFASRIDLASSYASALRSHDKIDLSSLEPRDTRDKPTVEFRRDPKGNVVIVARSSRFQHGNSWRIGTFRAVYREGIVPSSFSLRYDISTSENPNSIEGKLPVIVKRA